ncbi:ecto-ADP-ribosyltransferase 5-like [Dendrobates tinctorius]|uniref:ecto-ADP-ribosyltransferase 5-like n=1 Tax=Dendrobates tinctorius TaxID=92724 RepID=UPI003CCA5520
MMSHRVGRVTVLFVFSMTVTFQKDVVVESLDLAEQAFDDQYLGCKRQMERKLEKNNVLDAEISQNKKLKRAWEEANKIWMLKKNELRAKLPLSFEDNHGIALMTYTSFIREDFNNAVKLAGRSYNRYMEDFGFKWLHFYVTSALQLLSESELYNQNTIYSGIDENFELPPNGSINVKFGHFLYTSLDKYEATVMGNESLFIISEYHGVNIEDFSQFYSEREVLVPGYEVFTLFPATVGSEFDFELESTRRFCSNFNCAYINGESSKISVQSVHQCMSAAASAGRMHSLIYFGILFFILLVLVSPL